MNDKELRKIEKKNQKLNEKNRKIEEKRITEIEDDIKREEDEIRKAPIREKNRILNEPPKRSVLEEVGNSVTHGVGALFAIAALILLIIKSDTPFELASGIIYGICMLFTMSMSSLYHAFPYGSRVKRLWRRFDYTSIYLLIGGTFAPLLLVEWNRIYAYDNFFSNYMGIIIFIIQWVAIITGITLVSVFGPGRIKWLNFPLYFSIGWSGVLFIPGWLWLENSNLPLFFMILGGGLAYTLGMIPFAMKSKASHFIWHFFVLIGAIVQFLGIYLFVY